MPRNDGWSAAELALLHVATGAVATAGTGVAVVELVTGPDLPVVVASVAAVLVSAVVAVALHRSRLQRLVEAYPVAIAAIAASLVTVVPPPSIVSLGTLLSVLIAGLLSRRSVGLVTLAIHVAMETTGLVLGGADPSWTVASIVVGAAAHLATTSVMGSLRTAVVEREELAAKRDDFVATVSHELRTPVHVVAGIAETLTTNADRLDPDVAADLRERLAARTHDLRGLVDGLLDFSRLHRGRVRASPEALDVVSVSALAVERASGLHPDHRLEVAGPSTAIVLADPFLLPRVLDNLVTNACVHTPPGTEVRVTIDLDGDEVAVTVLDDGPGIAASDLPKLHHRFYRGGDHLRRPSGGLGLGLAYCQEVLHLHGAGLDVRSPASGGASFSFRLPVA